MIASGDEQTLPPLVDAASLERYVAARVPGDGEFSVERHLAGHSNETFFVTRGTDRWVLRRPPRPPYLPTAHDVGREYTVLSALNQAQVRAPRTVLYCDDESVIGAHFYLMERVEGTVIREAVPPEWANADDRRRIGFELVDAAAELHAVDYRAIGLDGWGKPDGYIGRQIGRWTKQLEGATALTRPLPGFVKMAEWLAAHQPAEQAHTIVQGDYKLDNTIFAPGSPPRLAAILDWEMATIGDPLADIGWMLSFWREPNDPPDPMEVAHASVFDGGGFPTRAELIDRYQQATGRAMDDVRFYIALAIWKLGILLEGSYARHLMGTTDDPFFAMLKDGVPAIGERALSLIADG